MTVRNHFGREYYVINKSFLLPGRPYFWSDVLVVKDATKHRLSSVHKLFLNKTLHFT